MIDLDERPNFIRAYMEATGTSEVPRIYHTWCALSVIAASLRREVWIEKFANSKLLPNLYTFLIGDSASGKNVAIDFAMDLISPFASEFNVYRGKISAPALIDELGKKTSRTGHIELEPSTPIYIFAPELALTMGRPQDARQLIYFLTEIYGGNPGAFNDRTRTSGRTIIQAPVVNFLFGSTQEWLMKVVTLEDIKGGFFARGVPILGRRNPNYRVEHPSVPYNYPEIILYLRERIQGFLNLRGEFGRTTKAKEIASNWYNTRDEPNDPSLLPSWYRQHDLTLKLAMLMSTAEDERTMEIGQQHTLDGQKFSQIVMINAPKLIDEASISPTTGCKLEIEKLLQKHGSMERSDVARRLSRIFNARQIDEAEVSLKGEKKIRVESRKGEKNKTKKVYVWIGSKKFQVIK